MSLKTRISDVLINLGQMTFGALVLGTTLKFADAGSIQLSSLVILGGALSLMLIAAGLVLSTSKKEEK